MRALWLDVECRKVEEVEVNELEDYYKLIDCRCVDIVVRKIGGKPYDIICDDEGLFKENNPISAVDENWNPMLVGNLIICGLADSEGELSSLTDDDMKHIRKRIKAVVSPLKPEGYPILTDCEY